MLSGDRDLQDRLQSGATAPGPCVDEHVSCDPPRLKVLVVEDDPGDYALIERALTYMAQFEPQITLAGTVEAALFAATADEHDVILLDYSMASNSGIDLLRDLGPKTGRCPCIVVSSHLTPETMYEANEAGVAACLAKDEITPRILETVIRLAVQAHALQCTLEAMTGRLTIPAGVPQADR